MVVNALENERFGLAAGINSAVSRLASVFAVALLAILAGRSATPAMARLDSIDAFAATAQISAAMAWLGGIATMLLLREGASVAQPVCRFPGETSPLAELSE
jgi:hypothetical protein